MNTYSQEEIREKIMQYHNLDGSRNLVGIDGVRSIMNKIESIQYDPLNVVGRNADLVLQARVRDYRESYLYDLLYKEHCLLDGCDKEMCIYNTYDFNHFAKVREEQTSSIVYTLKNRNQMGIFNILDEVEQIVKKNGPTASKDISIGEVRESRWGHKKLSSAALDYLYHTGKLCVTRKVGTQKYYDLTERVIDTRSVKNEEMSISEFLEWYIERRIRSLGVVWNKNGGAWQGHFIHEKELRTTVLQRLVEKGSITPFLINDIEDVFYSCKEYNLEGNIVKQNDYARFIAPLDNIM